MKYNAEQCCEFIRAVEAGKKIAWKNQVLSGVDTTLEHLISSLRDSSVELYIIPEPVVSEHWEVRFESGGVGFNVYETLEKAKAIARIDSIPCVITHVVTTRTEVL